VPVLYRHAEPVSTRLPQAVRGGHRHRRPAARSWFGLLGEILGSWKKTCQAVFLSAGLGLVAMGVLDALAGAGVFATGLTALTAFDALRRKRIARDSGRAPIE
jgi:hypothetical protein